MRKAQAVGALIRVVQWGGMLVLANSAAAQPGASAGQDQAGVATVVVTGLTPLSSLDTDAIGSAAQSASAEDLERSNATDLSAFIVRSMGSLYVNDMQGNPLQPDINYRGYTASPLLGTAQGLSVYLDGVRLNQPFGDVVSWDLIPRAAIRTLVLVPGTNPVFGLNSLGGALSLRSKDGFADPGTALQVGVGSFNRTQWEVESGGSRGDWGWYVTVNRFDEDGWRESSPSDAKQLFAKLSWRHADTAVSVFGSAADTQLTGNGMQEMRLLDADRRSVYTKPDVTTNKAVLAGLEVHHRFNSALTLAGNAWYRNIATTTFNGDLNEGALGQSTYQPSVAERGALAAAGYSGFPLAGESQLNTPFPRWRCIANALLNDEPNEKCNGLITQTATSQHTAGASLQFTLEQQLGSQANQLVFGAVVDDSTVHFEQASQFGYVADDRSIVAVSGPGAFADGTQSSESAFDARVDLGGVTRVQSVYFSDTLNLLPRLDMTLSGRYDQHQVRNRDAITPGGGPGSLDGDHRFSRFNPSLGLSYNAGGALSLSARYSQGSRAPSSIELGCADPANPCRLPNAMAGDPPLKQVVTSNWELGARGRLVGVAIWTATVFRADNRDDILFVADDQAGYGYFRNFGSTRRQGIELGADGRLGPLLLGLHYTLLDATFQSAETVQGSSNSSVSAVAPGFEGTIDIRPGNRIPLVPAQIVKVSLGWDLSPAMSVDADMAYIGRTYARGNENNQHQPDGVYYLGAGSTGGYAVVNLGLHWQADEQLKLFVQVNNVLDRKYSNAAQLGAAGFTATGAFVSRPFAAPVIGGERPLQQSTFLAPGAPRTLWMGVRYTLD